MPLTKSNIDKEAVAQVEKLNRYCEGKEISFLFVQLHFLQESILHQFDAHI